MTTRRTTSFPFLAALALAGCGASMPWSSPQAPAGGAQGAGPVTPASLTFKAWLGGAAPAIQTLHLPPQQPGMDVWFDVPPPAVWGGWYATEGFAKVGMAPPDQVGVGTHHGLITVEARWPHQAAPAGGPWSVPYTYVVGPPALDGLPAAVTVEQLFNGPWPDPVRVAVSGAAGAGPWTASLHFPSTDPPWLAVAPEGGAVTPGAVTLTVLRPPAYPSTQDSATLRLTRAGQVVDVPVVRAVRLPWLAVDATPVALAIEADQAERPAFSVRADTEAGAGVRCSVSVAYDPPIDYAAGGRSWLSHPNQFEAPQSAPFQLATTALAPGRHTATVTIKGDYLAASPPIVVTLDVAAPPASLAPGDLTFRLGPAATAASLQQSLVLTSLGEQVDWTASVDVPWLRVTPAGITPVGGASTLSVEIVPEALETLRCRWGSGAVTVSARARGGRVYEYRAAASLQLDLPCLVGAGPTFDVEGVAADLALVGARLSAAPWVQVGDVQVPIDPALALGGELRLALPSLPAGAYRVTVPTALGFSIGAATYRVVPPRRPAAAAFAAPGRKSRLSFDEILGALWSVNATTSEVERWDEAAGWTRQRQAIPGLKDALPLPDGATWLALAGAELSTFEVATFPSAVPIHWGWALERHVALAAPIDGHVLLAVDPVTCLYAECETNAWDQVTRRRAEFGYTAGARLGGSRSGLRMAIGDDKSGSARHVSFWWAGYASSGGGGPLPLGSFTGGVYNIIDPQQLALDRHGDKILILQDGSAGTGRSQLIDSAGRVVPGRLPPTIARALLTQPGDRAVAFDGVSRKVRIFDVNGTPDPSTGVLPELGTPGGFTPAGDPGAGLVLALSADDRTLFVGGDDRIVVVPLP